MQKPSPKKKKTEKNVAIAIKNPKLGTTPPNLTEKTPSHRHRNDAMQTYRGKPPSRKSPSIGEYNKNAIDTTAL